MVTKKKKYERNFDTCLTQRKIFALMINPTNPRFPRTQSEVANRLGLSKGTVSEHVKSLLAREFIKEIPSTTKEKHYRRGQNAPIIEKQIPADYLAFGELFDDYGRAIMTADAAERNHRQSSEFYKPLWRTHLNGGWLAFQVVKEGELSKIPASPSGEPVPVDLFPEVASYKLKGSLNWVAKVKINGSELDVRYQRTSNGKMIFYIVPGDVVTYADDMTPDEDLLTPFLRYCRPVLQWLEKYGGWTFKRDKLQEYDCAANVRQGKVGLTKEYGADPYISTLFKEKTGNNFGIPGVSDVWDDNSPGAMGDGELETNKRAYAAAIDALPFIHRQAEEIPGVLAAVKGEILQILEEVLETQYAQAISFQEVAKFLRMDIDTLGGALAHLINKSLPEELQHKIVLGKRQEAEV